MKLNPHSCDICVVIPGSSVTWGLQRFSEEQQINVVIFINLPLSLLFLFINLLFHMLLFFKTLRQAQVSKERSVAIGDPKLIKATGQASEIKTLGFDFVGILLCRGRETARLKIAFWVQLSEKLSVDLYKLILSQSMDRSSRAVSGAVGVGINPNVYKIYMECILKSPTERTENINREHIWANWSIKNS